jgi:lipopolysaccharide export system permease protein
MSLLVASLTAFARLSADSEVTAMKASRISLYHMIRPVLFFALVSFVMTAVTSLALAPGADAALKSHLFNMVKSRAMVGIEPGVFSSTFDGMVIFVDKMESLDKIEGIFISDERSAKEPYAVVARRGKLIADPQSLNVTLAMQEGSVHVPPKDEQAYSLMGFDSARLYLDINNTLVQRGSPRKGYEDFGSVELVREINRLRTAREPAYSAESELHKRLSIPFACLIVLGTATNLARNGTVIPVLAYWAPNCVMVFAAGLFVLKRGSEADFMISHRINTLYYGIKSRIMPPGKPAR